ncbi:hypothetical protein B5779_1658 [Bifidobacterium longum]|jgi:hypothetical protein|uniref:hypothetical protein n=1 Tax=Bifidobacterium longum TaxID=216816 RepID=UPI0009BB4203|nr:hypothetical protein [Bifidobacterium longum]OQM71704.1 hypothetical protein B5779_1658 [Bifidobacterium longum]
MSRYVENMNRHVHSRHMVEQDMDWLKEFRDDPDYPGPDAEPLRAWRSRDYQAMLYIDRDSGWKQPTGHAPEPGHDNDDNEQPSHHGGIQQIIIGGES